MTNLIDFKTMMETIHDQDTLDQDTLRFIVTCVPRRERTVLNLYYGLDGSTPMDWPEVARRIDATIERTQHYHDQAIKRLQALADLRHLA